MTPEAVTKRADATAEPLGPVTTDHAASDMRTYIFGLDVVRASAITLVIVSHMVAQLEFLGMLGVELFFVLSGYLVGGIFLRAILSRPAHPGRMLLAFWQRRWARTLPNYFLFLALFVVAFPQVEHGWPLLLRYAVFAQNLWYPVSDLFQISWSLAVEEWFYLVLPGLATLLLIGTRRALPSLLAVVAFLIVGCAVARLMPSIADFNRDMRMVVVYRLDALAYGVLGAILAQVWPAAWRACSRAWLVALIVFIALGLLLERYHLHMTNVAATVLLAAMPLAALLLLARSVTLADRPGPIGAGIRAISKWSYSIYLSHMLVFFTLYDRVPGYAGYGAMTKLAVKLLGVALILALSALVYTRFELPLLKRLSPRRAPH